MIFKEKLNTAYSAAMLLILCIYLLFPITNYEYTSLRLIPTITILFFMISSSSTVMFSLGMLTYILSEEIYASDTGVTACLILMCFSVLFVLQACKKDFMWWISTSQCILFALLQYIEGASGIRSILFTVSTLISILFLNHKMVQEKELEQLQTDNTFFLKTSSILLLSASVFRIITNVQVFRSIGYIAPFALPKMILWTMSAVIFAISLLLNRKKAVFVSGMTYLFIGFIVYIKHYGGSFWLFAAIISCMISLLILTERYYRIQKIAYSIIFISVMYIIISAGDSPMIGRRIFCIANILDLFAIMLITRDNCPDWENMLGKIIGYINSGDGE